MKCYASCYIIGDCDNMWQFDVSMSSPQRSMKHRNLPPLKLHSGEIVNNNAANKRPTGSRYTRQYSNLPAGYSDNSSRSRRPMYSLKGERNALLIRLYCFVSFLYCALYYLCLVLIYFVFLNIYCSCWSN